MILTASDCPVSDRAIAASKRLTDAFNLIFETVHETLGTTPLDADEIELLISHSYAITSRLEYCSGATTDDPHISAASAELALDGMRALMLQMIRWLDTNTPFVCRQIEAAVGHFFCDCATVRKAIVELP